MPYRNLIVETERHITTVKINRPRKLNALDRETFQALQDCFATLAGEAATQAIVVTGAGDKAFVVGADISNIAGLDALGAQEWCELGQRVFDRIEQSRKPVIAAINGLALGGGLELAMACHLRVAADTARLGQPEVTIGWIPGNGGTQRLPRLVGKGRALELILTGDPITAEEARWIGLVNRVVPAGDVVEEARALAARIIANSRSAVSLALQAINQGLDMAFPEALSYEASLSAIAASRPDAAEGTRAFLDKRKPEFKA